MTAIQEQRRSEVAAPARTIPRKAKREWAGWQFTAPFAAVFVLVFIAPLGYALYLSLFQNKLIGGNAFVGLDNYVHALSDPQFWDGFGRVLLFLVVQVPIMLILALVAALAIDGARLYASGLFRMVIFLPYAVPAVVAVLLWGFMYGNNFGLTANINHFLGSEVLQPLSGQWILASIGNIVTWEYVGYNMLIFYSALKTIPAELYEAAEIDGASRLERFWHITLPLLRPTSFFVLLISLVAAVAGGQAFDLVYVMTKGGPANSTTVLIFYIYQQAFGYSQFGYAAAMASFVVLILLVATLLLFLLTRGGRFNND